MRHSAWIGSLFLILASCALSCGGTDTVSLPTHSPLPGTATKVPVTSTATGVTLSTLCTKLASCFDTLTVDQCDTGLLATTNLAPTLGLSASSYPTYQSALDAETAGTLVPTNSSLVTTCAVDIRALACSSTLVQSAWSASSPTNFSGVAGMVPTADTSCHGIFR